MFDESAIIEYERERNEPQPEFLPTVRRSKFKFRWVILFFAGMVIFKLFGDLLSMI